MIEKIGAPGEIRTPDPQIRRTTVNVENADGFSKNRRKPGPDFQGVTGRSANRNPDEIAGTSVYDGRQKLGEIFDLPGCRAAAQLTDGTDLGTFASREAAGHAVIAAAKVGARP